MKTDAGNFCGGRCIGILEVADTTRRPAETFCFLFWSRFRILYSSPLLLYSFSFIFRLILFSTYFQSYTFSHLFPNLCLLPLTSKLVLSSTYFQPYTLLLLFPSLWLLPLDLVAPKRDRYCSTSKEENCSHKRSQHRKGTTRHQKADASSAYISHSLFFTSSSLFFLSSFFLSHLFPDFTYSLPLISKLILSSTYFQTYFKKIIWIMWLPSWSKK